MSNLHPAKGFSRAALAGRLLACFNLSGLVSRFFFSVFALAAALVSTPAHAAWGWNTPSATTDTYSDKVVITYSVAVADCSSSLPMWITVQRDGTNIASFSSVSGTYDDTTATPGVTHTYRLIGVAGSYGSCYAQPASSTTFTGRRLAFTPTAPAMTGASDGAFTDRVRISWTQANNASCGSIENVVYRNGVQIAVANTSTAVGSASYDDLTAVPGTTYGYWVTARCVPSGNSATSSTDSGYSGYPPPLAPTGVASSMGLYAGYVAVSWTAPNQTGSCTSASYTVVRDGVDQFTLTSIPLTGGSASWNDTGASTNTYYNYSVRVNCTPSGQTASASAPTTGYRAWIPSGTISALSATDGTLSDRIRVTANAAYFTPSTPCASLQYVLVRDGTDIANLGTYSGAPYTAALSYDDLTATPGATYNYSIRAVCAVGSQTSTTGPDAGFIAGTPATPTAVAASDGTFTDRVRVSWTAPNQSSQCSTVSYSVYRNGVPVGNSVYTTLTGGAASWDDFGATPGTTYNYTVGVSCQPGGNSATSAADSGFVAATPSAATGVSATDGTFTDRVRISWTAPNQSSICTSVSYDVLRDGAAVGTGVYTTLTGGAATWDDVTAVSGTSYSYSVRVTCTPGGLTSTSTADSGYRAGSPSAATAVVASDGTFADRVRVTWTAPNQTSVCTSVSYDVLRDGSAVGSSVYTVVAGGAASWDDTTAVAGTSYNYSVRVTCTPGGLTATSTADPGFRAGTPSAPTAVTATDGTFTDRVRIAWTAPNQSSVCASVSYDVLRNGTSVGAGVYTSLTGGSTSWDDTTAAVNTSYTYTLRVTCSAGGAQATSTADTGYRAGTPAAATAVAASDGTFTDRVRVTWTAPNQSAQCTSVSYDVRRNGSTIGSGVYTTLSGGAASWDDLTANVAISYTYSVLVTCSPGSQTALSATDTGYRAGTAAAPTAVAATDGTLTDRVTVTFTAPNQSAQCTSIAYEVLRNGALVGTSPFTTLTGGSGSYDDTTAASGTTYTYTVRAVCTPGGGASTSTGDTGFRAGSPSAATGVSATDGTRSTDVRVTFTAPAQPAYCTSIAYRIIRDGTFIGTSSFTTLSGGSATYDDTTATPSVTYSYVVRAVCTPGALTVDSSADTGYRAGVPLPATSVSSSDGTYTTYVRTTFVAPDQTAQCASISYVVTRNGVDQATIVLPTTGGAGAHSDMTAVPGTTYTYAVRSVCSPGGGTATSASDTGYALGTPLAPTALAASDGTFTDRVRVTWTSPNQSSQCASIEYLVQRGGTTIATLTTVPLSGGASSYDDMAAPLGSNSYNVVARCTPGLSLTAGVADTGYRAPAPFAATAVAATDGTFSDRVRVTFTAPDQSTVCTSVSYVVTMDGVDHGTAAAIPTTGGPGSYDAMSVSAGTHTFRVRSVCSVGSTTALSPTDSGYQLYTPLAVTAVAASDFTFGDRVRVNFTAPDQSARCTSINYVVRRDSTDLATITTVALAGAPSVQWDDTTAVAGTTYTYTVRSECIPGAATALSASDTGGRAAVPPAPTIAATDYTIDDRSSITITQPAVTGCTSISVVVSRDGTDIATLTSIPVTGGSANYDDVAPTFGAHTYGARTVCTPGGLASTTSTDTGGRRGWPVAPSAIAASDNTLADRIRVDLTLPASPQCTTRSVIIARGGTDIATITTIPVGGGTYSYDDMFPSFGTQTYTARSVCQPGATESAVVTDTGSRLATAPAPSSIDATDYVYLNKVAVTVGVPAASQCTTRDVVLRRNGTVIATITTVPVSGGSFTYDDLAAPQGVQTYTAESVCSPGGNVSATISDTGAVRYPDATCSAVSAPSTVFYPASPNASISITGVSDASLVRVRAWGSILGTNDQTYYTASGGPSIYSVGVSLANHATASPEYGTINVEARVTGKNPGDVELVCASTTFVMANPPAPISVSATDFTLTDRVRITGTVPPAPGCTSVSVQFLRASTVLTTQVLGAVSSNTPVTYDDIGGPTGVQTYGIRTVCNNAADSATSATVTDPGSRSYGPPICPAVSVPQPKYVYGSSTLVPVTATAPSNFSAIRFTAYGTPGGSGDLTSYTMTTSGSNQVGNVNLGNHASGTPEYGTINVTLYATGRDPGAIEQICTTTTFEVVQGCGPMTLTGPSGTGPLPSTISWNSSPAATQYILERASSAGGPWTSAGTFTPGTTTTTVPGWPAQFYRVQCVATDSFGNTTSPPVQISGNPPPEITPQTFVALNPATTTVTPVITDPDGNTTFTLAVTVPPVNGTATVSGSTILYTPNLGYVGNDPFTISATDPGGAVGTAVMTAQVQLLVPSVPENLVATDGTLIGSVGLTWDVSTYALSYKVFRGTSATDPSPALLGSPTTTTFSDTTASPGVRYFYSVSAINGPSESAKSTSDSGYADTPVTSLSWTATTPFNTTLDGTPTYTDPDPGDVPVFSVLTQPANGTASIASGKVRYVPNPTFVGVDTFSIRATDRAGAIASGTASITVTCQTPTLSTPAASPSRIFTSAGFSVVSNYNTAGCPQPSTISYELLNSSGTVIDSSSISAVMAAGDQPARFDVNAPDTAGTYTVRITLTNTITSSNVQKTASLVVNNFRPPVLQWSQTEYLQSVDNAVLRIVPSSDCAITNDPAVALADPGKCLVEPTGLPAGVSGGPQSFTVSYSGVPTTPGSYPTNVAVSMYSPSGVKRSLAALTAPIDVLPLASLVFTSPPPTATKMYTEVYSATPVQSSGPACQLTTLASATDLAASGRRGCVVDWDPKPADSYQEGNALKGVHFSPAGASATWTVSVVDASGAKFAASTGVATLNATPVAFNFGIASNPAAPYSILTNAIITGRSTGTDPCTVTGLQSEAERLSPRLCLLEFGTVDGLTPDVTNTPTLRGVFPSDGVINIPWTASVMFQGVKRQIMTGTSPLTVLPAAPPVLTLDRMREIAPDTYAYPVIGGFVAMLNTSTTQGQVNGQLNVSPDAPTTFTLLGNRSRQPLVAGPSTLYSSRTMEVNLALNASPSLSSTKTVTVVAVPRDGLRLRLVAAASAPDTAPLTISATVLQSTTEGLRYVAEEAGQWSVTFGEASSSGAFVPLAGPVLTDATGTASASISLEGRANLRLQARATPVSPFPGYTPTMNSNFGVVTVVKGTPVAGTLSSSSGLTGPAPFLSAYKVVFATFADHLFNDRYSWFTSSDGGATWNQVSGADGPQYSLRFPAGTTMVKVRLRNRATLEESETPPLTIDVYNVPKIVVAGPMYLYPSNAGTYTLSALDSSGAPYPSPVFDWTITQYGAAAATPPLATGTATTVTFTPPAAGIYRLNVRARDASTSASDPKAWVQTTYQFIGMNATPVSVSIAGSTRAEVGKSSTWTATVQPSFNLSQTNLTVGGQWTLPDGSVVPGATLNWTPTSADLATNSRPFLKFTGWVNGYESTTSLTKSFQLTLWEYVWPNWRLTKTQTSPMAPANVQYQVTPDNNSVLPVLEGLTYTWSVPPAVVVSGIPGAKLTGTMATAATADVSVTITDARGNTQTITDTVVATDPPPIVLDVTPQNLSRWSHAPITLGLTAKVTGGNPQDPVALWEYFLDGVKVTTSNTYTARLNLATPGVYSVEVKATTRAGAVATRSLTATAPANVPATCSPSVVLATNRRNMSVTANCVDPDGAITRYAWRLGGVPMSTSLGANYSYVLPATQVFPVTLELDVTDDGGAVSTSSFVIN